MADRILTGVALDPPRTLTPSKVTAFTNCPLAFRFSQIERRPEPPSPHSVKGTLVHDVLEGLFWHHAPGDRSPAAATAELQRAWGALQDNEEFVLLELDAGAAEAFLADARTLVDNYFRLEDPDRRRTRSRWSSASRRWSTACACAASSTASTSPLTASLIVVDYKTGRAPSERFERGSMGGVQTYALLCESVLGRGPGRGPAPVPAPAGRHLLGAFRADHPRPAQARGRRVDGHCAGLRRRGLPAPHVGPAVRLLPLQGSLPRVRRATGAQ